jgi:hypothetical protein
MRRHFRSSFKLHRNWEVLKTRVFRVEFLSNSYKLLPARKIPLAGRTVETNCSEIPNSCRQGDFPSGVEIGKMFIYRWNGDLKQRRHELLRQPDGFLRHTDFNAILTRLPGEDKELGGAVPDPKVFLFVHGIFLSSAFKILVRLRIVKQADFAVLNDENRHGESIFSWMCAITWRQVWR